MTDPDPRPDPTDSVPGSGSGSGSYLGSAAGPGSDPGSAAGSGPASDGAAAALGPPQPGRPQPGTASETQPAPPPPDRAGAARRAGVGLAAPEIAAPGPPTASPAPSGPGREPGATASRLDPAAPAAELAALTVAVEAARRSLLEAALEDLLQRRQSLQREITELERRRDQLQLEMARNFSGQSDAIARRLRGFQDYLVGALQDLVVASEQIELTPQPVLLQASPLDQPNAASQVPPPAAAGQFSQDEDLIRRLLRRYGGQPDFYADPWKLRRTLEASGAAILEDWFLAQGGRGAQPSSGSRSRNALIAAAAIAILGELYGDRFQTLVLAGQPERLGEWRRGLQDCLGLSREDFGPSSGIVLFERSDALIERADRLEERGELPFIVIDAAERAVEIPLLQFPLWLAFAAAGDELLAEQDLY